MSAHELSIGSSSEWYTPRHVFEAMGARFDLDVSSPEGECPADDYCDNVFVSGGLDRPWHGFVWMNPPFGGRNAIVPWLEKFFDHGDGVALCPDRTSAPWWQRFAPMADAIMFCSPKIHFIPGPGVVASSPGTGTTLFAAGKRGVWALENARRAGLGLVLRAAITPTPATDTDESAAQVSQPIREEQETSSIQSRPFGGSR